MSQATVIVLEMRPRWVPELTRQFLSRDVCVRGARSLAEARELLAGAQRGLLIVELEALQHAAVDALKAGLAADSSFQVIAIASRQTADLEWTVRELGVRDVLPEETSGEVLAAVCSRQWESDSPK